MTERPGGDEQEDPFEDLNAGACLCASRREVCGSGKEVTGLIRKPGKL